MDAQSAPLMSPAGGGGPKGRGWKQHLTKPRERIEDKGYRIQDTGQRTQDKG